MTRGTKIGSQKRIVSSLQPPGVISCLPLRKVKDAHAHAFQNTCRSSYETALKYRNVQHMQSIVYSTTYKRLVPPKGEAGDRHQGAYGWTPPFSLPNKTVARVFMWCALLPLLLNLYNLWSSSAPLTNLWPRLTHGYADLSADCCTSMNEVVQY